MTDSNLDVLDRPDGLLKTELEVLKELVRASKPRELLEIGMANGSSTVSVLSVLKELGSGRMTSVDPYQLTPTTVAPGSIPGYGGAGVKAVQQAGLSALHTLIAAPDYLALPKLVEEGRRFDFVFIDGYHSFDYALIDFFFADLLLRPGGTVVFHDSNRPTVLRVCQFVGANKAYRMIGPPLLLSYASPARRALRRLGHMISGQTKKFEERRRRWKSLAAFTKERDSLADEVVLRGM